MGTVHWIGLQIRCSICSKHIFNGLYMFNVDTIKGNSVKGIRQQRQKKNSPKAINSQA